MSSENITDRDRELARKCLECPICRQARKQGRGLAYLFVKYMERGLCPQCKAYAKVYGRKAHEPLGGDSA